MLTLHIFKKQNSEPASPIHHSSQRRKRLYFLPMLVALILVLFPFDWLSDAWPAFGNVFSQVFITAQDHEIGHTTIFFIAATLSLCSFPRLRLHPLLYLILTVTGALGEESIQSLFKLKLPNFGDGRDILCDIIGIIIAYITFTLILWLKNQSLNVNRAPQRFEKNVQQKSI